MRHQAASLTAARNARMLIAPGVIVTPLAAAIAASGSGATASVVRPAVRQRPARASTQTPERFFMIAYTAGYINTMKSAGKMRNITGKIILIGAFCIFSRAAIRRRRR